jgi:hypothetical protein
VTRSSRGAPWARLALGSRPTTPLAFTVEPARPSAPKHFQNRSMTTTPRVSCWPGLAQNGRGLTARPKMWAKNSADAILAFAGSDRVVQSNRHAQSSRPALRSTPHAAGQIGHPELRLSRWVAGDRASDSPTPTISPTSGVDANGHELGNATAERRSTAPRCRGRCDPRRRGLWRRSPSASHKVREPDPHAAAIAGASPKKRNRKRFAAGARSPKLFRSCPRWPSPPRVHPCRGGLR